MKKREEIIKKIVTRKGLYDRFLLILFEIKLIQKELTKEEQHIQEISEEFLKFSKSDSFLVCGHLVINDIEQLEFKLDVIENYWNKKGKKLIEVKYE